MKKANVQKWMDETVNQIQQQIHHSYLHQMIDTPDLDEERILLLLLPFVASGDYTDRDLSYVSTATLIQTALDTHEKVSVESADSLRNRQLTVLAGDYYSGLYYSILAKMGDISLIRKIASAIQEINEQKIELTSFEGMTMYEFLSKLVTVESAIIGRIYDHFQYGERLPGVQDLLILKRLIHEKQRYLQGEDTLVFRFLQCNGQNRRRQQALLDEFDQLYATVFERVKIVLEEEHYHYPLWPQHLFSFLRKPTTREKIFAEEG